MANARRFAGVEVIGKGVIGIRAGACVLFAIVLVQTTAACTNGPCRQIKNPELAGRQTTGAGALTGVVVPSDSGPIGGLQPNGARPSGARVADVSEESAAGRGKTVFVYKPDGSLQCGQGKSIPVAEMEKQLVGIQILSRENRTDGMMHVQVCGSPTGKINVYEVAAKSLDDALKRGFKKFDPQP